MSFCGRESWFLGSKTDASCWLWSWATTKRIDIWWPIRYFSTDSEILWLSFNITSWLNATRGGLSGKISSISLLPVGSLFWARRPFSIFIPVTLVEAHEDEIRWIHEVYMTWYQYNTFSFYFNKPKKVPAGGICLLLLLIMLLMGLVLRC